MPNALFVLSNGFEELEAVAPIDLLRRAGVEVTVASLETRTPLGRNNIQITADCVFPSIGLENALFDMIVLPGGPGVAALRQCQPLIQRLKAQDRSHRWIAAICAAPTVLSDAGILEGRSYTAHFSVAQELRSIRPEAVVRDGRVITSRGAGTAIEFGLALVEALVDKKASEEVARTICFQGLGASG